MARNGCRPGAAGREDGGRRRRSSGRRSCLRGRLSPRCPPMSDIKGSAPKGPSTPTEGTWPPGGTRAGLLHGPANPAVYPQPRQKSEGGGAGANGSSGRLSSEELTCKASDANQWLSDLLLFGLLLYSVFSPLSFHNRVVRQGERRGGASSSRASGNDGMRC
jgi:hypothetical protein